MGKRPSYDLITHYMTNMDPLFLDYCRQWLSGAAPDWERDVAGRVSRMSDRDIPNSMKGRAKEVVALIQFIRENGLSDGVADGLVSAINFGPHLFRQDHRQSAAVDGKTHFWTDRRVDLAKLRGHGRHPPDLRMAGCHQAQGDCLCRLRCLERFHRFRRRRQLHVRRSGRHRRHQARHRRGCPRIGAGQGEAEDFHPRRRSDEMMNNQCPAADEAGGAGVQVTAYTQTWSDIVARLGDSAKAGQVMGTTTR